MRTQEICNWSKKTIAPIFQRALIELTIGGIKPANDQLGANTTEELNQLFPNATTLEDIVTGEQSLNRAYVFGLLEYGSDNSFQYVLKTLESSHQEIRIRFLFPKEHENEHQTILKNADVREIEIHELPPGFEKLCAVYGIIHSKDYSPISPENLK